MVQRLFPIRDSVNQNDQTQSRLLILAGLIIVVNAITLTLAPAVRYHTGSERYQYTHWLGVIVWAVAFSVLHHQSSRKFTYRDPFILPVIAMLTGFGLMMIWRLYPTFGLRQTIWLAIASLLFFLGVKFPSFLSFLRRYKYLWLICGLLLTAMTILVGTNPNNTGPTLWYEVFGIHFQPSEALKLLLIIYLASYFTDQNTIKLAKIENFFPTIFVISTAFLVLFIQKDLGTASLILLIYLFILFTVRENKLLIWITPVLMLTAAILGYFFIDIIQVRINTWLNPFSDPTGTSYQIIQSLIGIAEGRIFGAGPGLGSPSLIPVSVSDFIFAAITEEFGFLGASIILLLVIVLLYRGTIIALSTANSFYRYLALGLVFYFGVQSSLIIGGNIGLLPLTGVTLPFVSYGGSSLVVSFIAGLILLTISNQALNPDNSQTNNQPRFATASAFLIALLLLEILVTSLISFWFMPSLTNRPENPRWIIDDRFVKRGDILDRNNYAIISSVGDVGDYRRISNHTPLYPIVGYTNSSYGQTGIELSMFDYLRGYEGYAYSTQFTHDLLYNQPPEGLNVRLTLDFDLQRKADTLLANTPGTIILLNASSGEILAMASHPYFDAANLETEWSALLSNEDAPLLNRATVGQYPPGNTLFPFVLANLLEQNPDSAEIEFILPNRDSLIDCVYPPIDSPSRFQMLLNACQNLQFDLAGQIGTDSLFESYQALGLFSEPDIRLNVAEISLPDLSDTAAFNRGDYPFNVTPLQMALAACSLSNEGILPGPRIVNAFQNPQGDWVTLPKLSNNLQVLSPEVSQKVTDLMQVGSTPFWQVTATVSTENDQSIAWFIAGTIDSWQGQPTIVVVLLETNAPNRAAMIGTTLLEQTTGLFPQP
jgi:cell division protein FtsW (lipid II flippase)